MRVAVTGANGFIGRALCAVLARDGHSITSLVRGGAADLQRFGAVATLDERSDPQAWARVLQPQEAVVHLAGRAHQGEAASDSAHAAFVASNVEYTRALLAGVLSASIGRLVFMSSSKVFGEVSPATPAGAPRPFSGDDPPAPCGPYGESKLAAEQLLRTECDRHGVSLTIFRPPLVYGPGVKGNLQALLWAIHRGFPLPFAAIDNRRSLVHRDGLCDAILRALACADARTRILTLADLEVSTPDLIRAMARGLGRRPRLWHCPVTALRLLGRMAGRASAVARLTDSFLVDDQAIAHELGWRAQTDQARAWHEIGEAFRRGSPA